MLGATVASLLLAPNTWTLIVGGDVMLNAVKANRNPFTGISQSLKQADIAYVNLEVPLTSAKTPTRLKSAAEIKARNQYVLKADPAHGRWLAESGIDVVSLGNNHAMDYGPQGLREMLGVLRQNKIAHCGAGENRAEAWKPAVIKLKNGLRIGFISSLSFLTEGAIGKCGPAGEKSPGIAGLTLGGSTAAKDVARLKAIVNLARKSCDVLVVCPHWGVEKQSVPRPYQVSLGRAWIEQGADAVIGTHAHVLQGYERYHGKPIFYSTGNLVSPKAGSTALFRLTFEGRKLGLVEVLPATYSGGQVKLEPIKNWKTRLQAWDRLNAALAKAYPIKRR